MPNSTQVIPSPAELPPPQRPAVTPIATSAEPLPASLEQTGLAERMSPGTQLEGDPEAVLQETSIDNFQSPVGVTNIPVTSTPTETAESVELPNSQRQEVPEEIISAPEESLETKITRWQAQGETSALPTRDIQELTNALGDKTLNEETRHTLEAIRDHQISQVFREASTAMNKFADESAQAIMNLNEQSWEAFRISADNITSQINEDIAQLEQLEQQNKLSEEELAKLQHLRQLRETVGLLLGTVPSEETDVATSDSSPIASATDRPQPALVAEQPPAKVANDSTQPPAEQTPSTAETTDKPAEVQAEAQTPAQVVEAYLDQLPPNLRPLFEPLLQGQLALAEQNSQLRVMVESQQKQLAELAKQIEAQGKQNQALTDSMGKLIKDIEKNGKVTADVLKAIIVLLLSVGLDLNKEIWGDVTQPQR